MEPSVTLSPDAAVRSVSIVMLVDKRHEECPVLLRGMP